VVRFRYPLILLSACGMYSLIETAKQNNLIPNKYLTAVFEKARLLFRLMTGKSSFPGTFLSLKLTILNVLFTVHCLSFLGDF